MMLRTMHRHSIVPALVCAALLACAAPSFGAKAGPQVRLEPACYQSGERGVLTGGGFTPNATWTAKLGDTRKLGSGRTDEHGRIRARFTAPTYHGTEGTKKLTLSVADGKHTARTTLLMTPLTATFSPRTGDPATMRVRWRVLGLTPKHGVYVHYIKPDHTFRRTVRIGMTRGDCGTLKTGPIALFPFRYTYGRWTLQVDSSPHYSRATLPRLLIDFEIKKPEKKQEQEQEQPPTSS